MKHPPVIPPLSVTIPPNVRRALKKLWKQLERDLVDADKAEDVNAFCEARGALAGAESVLKVLNIENIT